MAHKKKHGPGPVPPANQPRTGPPENVNMTQRGKRGPGGGAPLQEHGPKGRIGGFQGAGEHAQQQPIPLNDAQ